jgi:hypothetical protein
MMSPSTDQLKRTGAAGLVGIFAASAVFLAGWVLEVIVGSIWATSSEDRSPIPSPWSDSVVWPLLFVAAAVGVYVTRRRASKQPLPDVVVASGVAAAFGTLAVLLIVSPPALNDGHFVDYFHRGCAHSKDPKGVMCGVSDAAILAAGHQACDWLRGQPIGQEGFNSPSAWAGRYAAELQASGLTAEERLSAWLAKTAWYELCPFQRQVHHSLGGNTGSSD